MFVLLWACVWVESACACTYLCLALIFCFVLHVCGWFGVRCTFFLTVILAFRLFVGRGGELYSLGRGPALGHGTAAFELSEPRRVQVRTLTTYKTTPVNRETPFFLSLEKVVVCYRHLLLRLSCTPY